VLLERAVSEGRVAPEAGRLLEAGEWLFTRETDTPCTWSTSGGLVEGCSRVSAGDVKWLDCWVPGGVSHRLGAPSRGVWALIRHCGPRPLLCNQCPL
jgi:hypothetical protein